MSIEKTFPCCVYISANNYVSVVQNRIYIISITCISFFHRQYNFHKVFFCMVYLIPEKIFHKNYFVSNISLRGNIHCMNLIFFVVITYFCEMNIWCVRHLNIIFPLDHAEYWSTSWSDENRHNWRLYWLCRIGVGQTIDFRSQQILITDL